MRVKLGCTLISNRQCFIRFIKETELYAQIIEDLYEHNEYRSDQDFEEVVAAIRFNELDKEFRALLTPEEKLALKYLNSERPDFEAPDNYESLISSSFDKWVEIFFKDKNPLLDDINPIVLGKVMRIIRITSNIKKTVLAKQLGVDRSTIALIEKGKRLPSLSYIFKFSKVFKYSVDSLINCSIA